MYPLMNVIRRNLGNPGVKSAHHGTLSIAHVYCRLSLSLHKHSELTTPLSLT